MSTYPTQAKFVAMSWKATLLGVLAIAVFIAMKVTGFAETSVEGEELLALGGIVLIIGGLAGGMLVTVPAGATN